MKEYKTIVIIMKDGKYAEWEKDSWNDYTYDGKCFIVMKDGAYIGFYNIDEVRTIVVE